MTAREWERDYQPLAYGTPGPAKDKADTERWEAFMRAAKAADTFSADPYDPARHEALLNEKWAREADYYAHRPFAEVDERFSERMMFDLFCKLSHLSRETIDEESFANFMAPPRGVPEWYWRQVAHVAGNAAVLFKGIVGEGVPEDKERLYLAMLTCYLIMPLFWHKNAAQLEEGRAVEPFRQQVIDLVLREGRTYDDAAECLGRDRETIKYHLRQAAEEMNAGSIKALRTMVCSYPSGSGSKGIGEVD